MNAYFVHVKNISLAFFLMNLSSVSISQENSGNLFEDPFIRITQAIVACPVQNGPMISPEEKRLEEHWRVERGTSCFQAGRCRLPNSYLYDKEIVPRVAKAILADGRFMDTSIWAEGQRRWVTLTGCVSSKNQSEQVEKLVRNLDDVESVINKLTVIDHSK